MRDKKIYFVYLQYRNNENDFWYKRRMVYNYE